MKNLYIVLLFLFCLKSFSQTSSFAESVEYDPVNNRFLCSNDTTSIVEIDPNGNLSYFGNGLPSNFGMEIIGNHLFSIVATNQTPPVNVIRVYDLTTEMEINSLMIPNANLLNGMTSDGISKIWVTDFTESSIYEIDYANISQPTFQKLVDNTNIPNFPNGITYDQINNRLVFVSWDDTMIRQVNLQDLTVSVVLNTGNLSNMDGIDMDNDNNFYVSSWSPDNRITKFSNDFSSSENLNIPGLLNPADICIAKDINVLAIPSQQQNVILWPLSSLSVSDLGEYKNNKIELYPNPSNGISNLKILDNDWKNISYTITDINGRIIEKVDPINIEGEKKIILDFNKYSNGYYNISLLVDSRFTINKKIIIDK